MNYQEFKRTNFKKVREELERGGEDSSFASVQREVSRRWREVAPKKDVKKTGWRKYVSENFKRVKDELKKKKAENYKYDLGEINRELKKQYEQGYYVSSYSYRRFYTWDDYEINLKVNKDDWSIDDLYDVFTKMKPSDFYYMKLFINSERVVTVKPEYLQNREDFKNWIYLMKIGDYSGSDPIENEEDIDTFKFGIMGHDYRAKDVLTTIMGLKSRDIFSDIFLVKEIPDAGGECLYNSLVYLCGKNKFFEVYNGKRVEINRKTDRLRTKFIFYDEKKGEQPKVIKIVDINDTIEVKPVREDKAEFIYGKLMSIWNVEEKLGEEEKSISIVNFNNHFQPYFGLALETVYRDRKLDFYREKEGKLVKIIERITAVKSIEDSKEMRVDFSENTRNIICAYDFETIYDENGQLKPYSCAIYTRISRRVKVSEEEKKDKGGKLREEIEKTISEEKLREILDEITEEVSFKNEDILFYYKFGGKDFRDEVSYEEDFYFGEDCVIRMFDKLLKLGNDSKICLLSYNGAKFDNYFIIPELLRRDMLEDIFFSSNSVLNIKWGGRHTTFDLCKYLQSSLKSACGAFKVENSKLDFDHSIIQEYYKKHGELDSYFVGEKMEELKKYNIVDCKAVMELYFKVEEVFKNTGHLKEDENLYERKTIGGLAYRKFAWTTRDIPLPKVNDRQLYEKIRGGLVAGRTEVLGSEDGRTVVKVEGEIKVIDVKSLYPYVMLNRDYPCGEIIEIDARDGLITCIKKKLIGFFNCRFNQANLRVNILPRREKGKPLDWKYKGQLDMMLNTVDIKALLDNGCKVELYGKGIMFSDTVSGKKLFKCQEQLKKIKDEQDALPSESRNLALRNMVKLMLNSLSGKVNESIHYEDTKLIKKLSELNKINKELNSKKINAYYPSAIYNETAGLITIDNDKDKTFKKQNSKPFYIGILIYAYARQHMYESVLRDYKAYYMDTDSAFMGIDEFNRFVKERGHLLGGEFGQFEDEAPNKKLNKSVYFAPKNYFVLSDGKLVKKGFKGVKIDRDKFIGGKDKKNELIKDGVDLAKLYNDLPTVAEKIDEFIEDSRVGNVYVLCSSLIKLLRNQKKTNKSAGGIYQRYLVKKISINN